MTCTHGWYMYRYFLNSFIHMHTINSPISYTSIPNTSHIQQNQQYNHSYTHKTCNTWDYIIHKEYKMGGAPLAKRKNIKAKKQNVRTKSSLPALCVWNMPNQITSLLTSCLYQPRKYLYIYQPCVHVIYYIYNVCHACYLSYLKS